MHSDWHYAMWRLAGLLTLLCCLLSAAVAAEEAEAALRLNSESRLSVYNGIYHYIKVNAECSGVDRLVMRVYKPDGSASRYNVKRRNAKAGAERVLYSSFEANEEGNWLDGAEVLFRTGAAPGVWIIEVQGLRNKEILVTATLPVEVRSYKDIQPADYDMVHSLLIWEGDGQQIIPGRIRFVTQMKKDSCFVASYWKSKYYNLTDTAQNKCTRAVFSMGLSWLGVDCTPVRMSELTRAKEIYYTYEHVIRALGNVEQIDGTLEELWRNYQVGEASPIEIHFTHQNGMHALLLIARDSENPELYYAVNSGDGVDAESYGGAKHEHIIPILIEKGEIGAMIQSPLVKRFNQGKLDVICQWRRIGETDHE